MSSSALSISIKKDLFIFGYIFEDHAGKIYLCSHINCCFNGVEIHNNHICSEQFIATIYVMNMSGEQTDILT